MKIERVTLDSVHSFIGYCGRHLAEHDDSYPPNAELVLTEGYPAMLSVHPEHRGRGLGRTLLRQGIRITRAAGYLAAELSDNAENENAVHLYLSEGFYQTQLMLCYRLDLVNQPFT